MDKEFRFAPVYDDEQILISGIGGLDMRALWDEACTLLEASFKEDRNWKGEGIRGVANGHREENRAMYIFMLSHVSSQGIFLEVKTDGHSGRLVIPWMASSWDIRLAFTLMRQIRSQMPSATFIKAGDDGGMDLSEDAEGLCYRHRETNIRQIASEVPAGAHVPVQGCNHRFYMPNKADWPDLSDEEFIQWSMVHLLHAQWGLADLNGCTALTLSGDNGDEEAILLDNTMDVWVLDCPRMAVANRDNDVKVVSTEGFIGKVKDNMHFVTIDLVQFGLRKMPAEKWEELWKDIDASARHLPRTWLLRWNPAISNFRMEDYDGLLYVRSDQASLNWSFFIHEGLQPGDWYYMERVGDGDTGLVFRGRVCSEAYPDKDWAGTERERYYADLTIEEISEQALPIVTTEWLQKALQELEWGHGHSGVPLTNVQTGIIGSLWQEGFGKPELHDRE